MEVLAQAMLPIAGRTGLVFLQESARALVTSFDVAACLFVQRITLPEPGEDFRPIVAFASGTFVEAALGTPAPLAEIEARTRALVGSSERSEALAWHCVPAGPDAALCVLAHEVPDALRFALSFIAARCPAEVARSTSDARAKAERLLGMVSGASGDLVWDWELATDRVEWSFGSLAGGVVTFAEWRERMHPHDRERVLAVLEEFRAGQRDRWMDLYRFLLRDGASRIGNVRAVLERSSDGKPARVIGSLQDITEAKAQEHRLVIGERMAAMGTLAAGIAHEINNPLAYVKGNVEHVLEELRGVEGIEPDLIAALDEAREGAERVRRIVQDLRLFSRPEDDAKGAVDVDRVVEGTLAILSSDIERRARLEKMLRRPPPADANETRLGHVFLALVSNAIQALPEGAKESHVIGIESGVDEAGRIFVVVRDSGPGIPGEIVGRIFDPFFTTKRLGAGTGLGLSIAHSIVTSVGGEISVDSTPGAGTKFRVTLPAHH